MMYTEMISIGVFGCKLFLIVLACVFVAKYHMLENRSSAIVSELTE